jgi:hypothetical protein
MVEIKIVTGKSKEAAKVLKLLQQAHAVVSEVKRAGEDVKQGIVIEAYLTKESIGRLESEGVAVQVIRDLSESKDPRTFVSKENRFRDALEKLRQTRRR